MKRLILLGLLLISTTTIAQDLISADGTLTRTASTTTTTDPALSTSTTTVSDPSLSTSTTSSDTTLTRSTSTTSLSTSLSSTTSTSLIRTVSSATTATYRIVNIDGTESSLTSASGNTAQALGLGSTLPPTVY